jgi:hypothetical protein
LPAPPAFIDQMLPGELLTNANLPFWREEALPAGPTMAIRPIPTAVANRTIFSWFLPMEAGRRHASSEAQQPN